MPDLPSTPVRPRRRWSFSLRTLMIVVLLAGVPLARVINRASRQRQAVAAILAAKGSVAYDYHFQGGDPVKRLAIAAAVPPGPAWLRRWLGDEYFQEVVEVSLTRPVTATVIAAVGQLDRLKMLSFTYISQGDDDLTHLGGLDRLESLTLQGYGLNDRNLVPIGRLTSLQNLQIQTTSLTDAGLAPLGALTRLRSLGLSYPEKIASPGWITLAGRLPQLLELDLRWTAVDDSAIEAIGRIPNLTSLVLTGTQVTPGGVARLRQARPQLQVVPPR